MVPIYMYNYMYVYRTDCQTIGQLYILSAFCITSAYAHPIHFLLQMIYILTLLQQYLQAQVTTMQTVLPDTQSDHFCLSPLFTEHSPNICRGGCVSERCECSCSSCVPLYDELGCLVSAHCLLTVAIIIGGCYVIVPL